MGARTGATIHLVFDGDGPTTSGSAVRRGLRVSFTPEGTEADEAILGIVDATPLDRPVAVATDDRRVRREAAARGANVLTQEQLFHLLG
jgi:predicted RNA-binding protein with PIN domain